MLVVRRMIDRRRAYTALFLPGEEPRIFPTTDQEHARILEIFLQDRRHPGVCNDFTEFDLGGAAHQRSTGPFGTGIAANSPAPSEANADASGCGA